jgi:phage protein D/phage baseplate assembly protein gpV
MPESSADTVPLYRILIDGQELDPVEANFVHEIKITDWLRLPDVCTLAVGYQAKTEGNAFQALDDSKFEVGAKLEVKLGSTDERTTTTIFKGEIVTVEPDFQAGGVSMVVRAYDKSHRMMRGRKQRTFLNKTVSDIVKQIGQEHGLSVSTKPSGGPLDSVLQHNETDWDFIWRMARRVGFEFLVTDESKAEFGPPALGGEVELAYPDDLHTFRPRITAVQQVEKVNVRGFDLKSKKEVLSTKSRPEQLTEAGIKRADIVKKFSGDMLEISGQSFSSNGEADKIAQSMLDQLANAYLAAEGSCHGNPNIKAGTKLKITGVGNDFSGTYRVAKATHLLGTAGGYTTEFSNSAGEHTLLGQSNSNSNGGGIQIDSIVVGIVTNNKDPEGYGRIRVQLPAVSGEETFWAPVLLTAAGKERGLSMLPVVGEQVVVAFENGDPSYPYVLGSMFNGKDTPGDELALDDGSFAMKSDHKALIAAQEDIKLRTEKGKWEIEVNSGEIKETVKSPGNYTGKFDGAWKLDATGAMTVESKQSVTIKAPSITVEAQGTMALKANGQLTVESKGVLELKGATVMVSGQAAVNISGGLINLG